MQQYIGTKLIYATPMNRLAYNKLRGWELPADENGTDEGYLVEYISGGEANFKGCISWSPTDVFELAHRKVDGMSFGLAIEALKSGLKVTRAGWNGKGMWLTYTPGTEHICLPVPNCHVDIEPHIDMYTAKGTMCIGWLASQADMLADDWQVIFT